jgi:hypothetical protein
MVVQKMTNEEAIRILKIERDEVDMEWLGEEGKLIQQAYDLAIKALETGEIYITGEDYNLYMRGYNAGKKDFEPKQGEWIDIVYTNNGIGVGKCNQCGMRRTVDNFCPNCGADMRKGGAE